MVSFLGIFIFVIAVLSFLPKTFKIGGKYLSNPFAKLLSGNVPSSAALLLALSFLFLNPFGYNKMGYRQVVETPTGNKYIVFENGVYVKMPWSDVTEYPNVITVAYVGKNDPLEGTITVKQPPVEVQFRDGTKSDVTAIARVRLPNDQDTMLKLHSEFRHHTKLATSSIAPYVKECLKAAGQLMESETVYTGGRSQLSGDWQDQLENGMFIIDQRIEDQTTDSLTRETERVYINEKRMVTDANGKRVPVRINSDIAQFGITVASANLMDIDYEQLVDDKIKKKVESSTREAVSKQELVTARQEALTEAEKGKQKLIEIEYQEKQRQTQEVVQAETEVKLAGKNKEKQSIALEAARLEAQKIKALADAEAYAKKQMMEADGALKQKLDAWVMVNSKYAEEFAKQKWVPEIQLGGSTQSGNDEANALLKMLMVQSAKDISLDLKVKE